MREINSYLGFLSMDVEEEVQFWLGELGESLNSSVSITCDFWVYSDTHRKTAYELWVSKNKSRHEFKTLPELIHHIRCKLLLFRKF